MNPLSRTALLLLLALPQALSAAPAAGDTFKRVADGTVAPSFQLPLAAGGTADLEAHRGGPLTVLVFWSPRNPKSEALLKDAQQLLDEFGEKGPRAAGLRVVAVRCGEASSSNAPGRDDSWLEKAALRFPLAVDATLEVCDAWGPTVLPAAAFLAKDLKVAYELSGRPSSAYQDMRRAALELLGLRDEEPGGKKARRERYKPANKAVTLNYDLARTLYERGQLTPAARKLEKVLTDDPKFPDAHALHGALLLASSRTDGKQETAAAAREAFGKALELDATTPLALAGLSYLAWKDGDLTRALELARKAAEFAETPLETPGKEAVDPGARLAAASDALAAGNPTAGGAELEKALDVLLDLPQGPKLKKSGLVDKVRGDK